MKAIILSIPSLPCFISGVWAQEQRTHDKAVPIVHDKQAQV